jgi:ATP-binding cassette, subfamily B, bacterial
MVTIQQKSMNDKQTSGAFLWSIIKPYKYFYLMMSLAPICTGFYPIIYNYAVKLLIDLFTQFENITFKQAFWPIFWFFTAQIILDGGWRIHNFAQLKTMPYVFQDIMNRICRHVFYLPHIYFQNNLSGTITSKMRGIGDNYYAMHQDIEFKLSKPLLITIFSGIALIWVNYKIFLFALSFIGVYSLFASKFFTTLARLEQAKQDAWYYLFGTIADRIQNITNIFAFATRENEIKTVDDYYRNILNPISVKYYKYDLKICIFFSLLYWVFLISVFVFVIHLKNLKLITIGDIAFIISMTFIFSENSWHTGMAVKEFLEDIAKFKTAFELMQVPKCSIDNPNAKELKLIRGEIIWKDVTFSYEKDSIVFTDLNLHIKPGEKAGLVGYSGSGKSTLVSLLLKNFKVTKGDIYVDNHSIYDVTTDSLRANIALIPQDIILFHRSIGENIGYAKLNATQEEIEQAAKMANIHDFIVNLPQGYNTLVGERGLKLSGGQRQRIAIARAMLKNAAILILDEATSSLDSQTENEIQNSINAMLETNKATIIAIAHRLSTIKNMDRIIVFDNGQIVEEGSFLQLIQLQNGKFKELWEHQVNGMLV